MTQTLVAVDSSNWTAVVCPISCKTVIFDNNETSAQNVYRRIDSTDANTQKLIPAGVAYTWQKSADERSMSAAKNFVAGATIASLKSTAGSFNVAVEFIE